MKRYHYTARMVRWTHSPEDFRRFRSWARGQKDFWWNYLSGNLAAFSFWAYPDDVKDLFEEQGWYIPSLSINVTKSAVPEEER